MKYIYRCFVILSIVASLLALAMMPPIKFQCTKWSGMYSNRLTCSLVVGK